MPAASPSLDRQSVIQHLTHATHNGFSLATAQKLLAAYDLGLIVCTGHNDGLGMEIHYTALGQEWSAQGQQWGVA